MIDLPPPDPAERVVFNPAQERLATLEKIPDLKVLSKTRRKRVSRWDRPPEPHDWRWAIGHLGRMLITLGLLMFGFVAYQLWGTGIQEARSQHQLRSAFDQILLDQGVTVDTIAPAESVPAPIDTVPGAPTGGDGGVPTTVPTVAPTVVPTTPATVPAPVEPVRQKLPEITEGSPIALIKIPSLGVSKAVVAGVSVKDLRKGPGHFPNTPFPGQLGNVAIAGHRTTFSGPFLHLDELKPGDDIEITTILGDSYLYKVTGAEEVGKDAYFVVTRSDPTKATLTLITCTPIGTASRRLVVYAELEVGRSSAVGVPEVNYGQAFVATPDTELPDEQTPVGTGDVVDTTPATVDVAGTPGTVAPQFTDGSDAFNQGWFADSAAWPQVLAWGAALIAVWVGAFMLAKRFRRLWLGIVVGVVPFVVLLYFFYENINRLLPSAI